MKKIIIYFLISIIFIVGLFYYSKIRIKNDRVVISFSSWGSESELKILKPLIAQFELENSDIKVEFLHIPQNYFQKIHLLFASNTAPDVLFINNYYLPMYANAGVLENLTEYDTFFELNDFYSKSLSSLSYNSNLYAIPRDISTLVIFYNKDFFDKYKISYPNSSWSYDDFLHIARLIKEHSNKFAISFDEDLLFYYPYLMSFGCVEFPNLDNPDVFLSLNRYSDLRNKYYVAPAKSDIGSATMGQMFLQQNLAMHLSGRWMVPKYREEANFDWDVVQFPQGKIGSVVPIDSSGWAISKNSNHKAEALRFVKFLASKPSSEAFTKSGLITPARIDVSTSSVFLDDKLPHNAEVFLEAIKTSVPTPVSIDYKEKVDLLNKKTERIFNK